MYTYTQQYRNSAYMKFSLQATLKWAAQCIHSKVIRLVMHNANTQAQGGPAGAAWVAQADDNSMPHMQLHRQVPGYNKHQDGGKPPKPVHHQQEGKPWGTFSLAQA